MRKTVQETIAWLQEHFKSTEDIYLVSITKDEVSDHNCEEVSQERFVAMCEYVDKSYDIDQTLIDSFGDAFGATDKFDPAEQTCEPESTSEIYLEMRNADANYGARDE